MISIVMTYHNRLKLLDFTLTTIANSQHTDYEVIIVDDFSEESESPDQLVSRYDNIDLRVIKMANIVETKTYINPCIPYNVGFGFARGNKIIIQNSECCHVGDVLTYTNRTLNDNVYLVFHCYGSTENEVGLIHKGEPLTLPNHKSYGGDGNWRCHKTFRPEIYHYTTAITRNRLRELNGFDERFGNGFAVDDDEFARRVRKLMPSIQYVAKPYVIHQYHERTTELTSNDMNVLANKNVQLLKHISTRETNITRAHNNGKIILGDTK